ncbi:MAG: hypothetical protein MUF06_13765, partial [Pirellulaceae bacterium]|nr:hypothetical protein [Pirellulaceae bacterium]
RSDVMAAILWPLGRSSASSMRPTDNRRRMLVAALLAAIVALSTAVDSFTSAAEPAIHTFERQQLTDVYYSEGIAAGDLNADGHADIVYGPYWFAGPEFTTKREIYPAKAQPRERYADHFFAWVHDFNGDGLGDVLTAGFPGTPGFVYENPGPAGHDKPWPKHQVLDSVSNESPQWVNLVGDEQPELVCSRKGFFGYASPDPNKPFAEWTFHPLSEKIAPVPFGHGLGVGDIDGDGRIDLITKDGWFQQPADLAGDPLWTLHKARFAGPGGAEMYAYDVDGDGDNDVITSLAAHDFGLAWHEQLRDGDKIVFREHLIMGDRPAQNAYGLVFSELHSVNLADIDGDGLKDIVTGKTYWSHHTQSPMWDAGAVVYWFRLVRGKDGVDWVPYRADDDSGIGRQVIVADLNKDGLPDLASGGMKGAHVLRHRREAVSAEKWQELQPKRVTIKERPPLQGEPAKFDASGLVAGAIEAESLAAKVTSGKTSTQKMAAFKAGQWSGGEQLFWTGGKPGETLTLEFEVPKAGKYAIAAALTMARDYAIVQPALDGEKLGEPLDLYHGTDVLTSGEVALGTRELAAGKHTLTLEVTGANPSAVQAFMVGVDYLRLKPE